MWQQNNNNTNNNQTKLRWILNLWYVWSEKAISSSLQCNHSQFIYLSKLVDFQTKSTTNLSLQSVGTPTFDLSSIPTSSPKLSGILMTCPTPDQGLWRSPRYLSRSSSPCIKRMSGCDAIIRKMSCGKMKCQFMKVYQCLNSTKILKKIGSIPRKRKSEAHLTPLPQTFISFLHNFYTNSTHLHQSSRGWSMHRSSC